MTEADLEAMDKLEEVIEGIGYSDLTSDPQGVMMTLDASLDAIRMLRRELEAKQ